MSEGTWTGDTSRASSEDVLRGRPGTKRWYYTKCGVYRRRRRRGLGEERVLQFQTPDVKEKGSGQPTWLEGTFLVLLINYLRAYTAPCNQIYIIACKTFLCAGRASCVWGRRKGFSGCAKKPLEIRKFDRISNSWLCGNFRQATFNNVEFHETRPTFTILSKSNVCFTSKTITGKNWIRLKSFTSKNYCYFDALLQATKTTSKTINNNRKNNQTSYAKIFSTIYSNFF